MICSEVFFLISVLENNYLIGLLVYSIVLLILLDIRAIKLWLEYRYGRPNTTVAMETTTTNINFKELINWE